MFLAGKAEETPRPLKDVINFSYEIINEKDPGASQKIKQKELYERQKELILNGEKIVLSTLAFDLNVYHPYRPLVKAIKKFKEVYEQQKELILNGEKIVLSTLAFDLDVCHPYKSLAEAIKNFKVAQNALAQVAWNFASFICRTIVLVFFFLSISQHINLCWHILLLQEVYEKQKELILNGERIVLSTLAFDVNVYHPYKPHGEAINKFKVAQSALAQVVWSSLAQVAWNFVNDSLRTSLCLQFKPHHIAAGAIFLAAKFLKVKLPSDGEKVWWQEFDVTPQQLEDVSIQMLELYEQIPVPPSQGSEVESSVGGGSAHLPGSRNAELADEHTGSRQTSVRPTHEHSSSDYNGSSSKSLLNQYNDNGGVEAANASVDHKDEIERETKGSPHPKSHPANKDYMREALHNSTPKVEGPGKDKSEREGGELKDDGSVHKSRNVDGRDAPISQSPKDLKLLQDIVKAKREKAKKLLGERTRKKDWMDEDDLLEDVELAVEDEKTKQRKVQSRPKVENSDLMDTEHGEIVELKEKVKNTEEGEMVNYVSPTMHSRKRKMGSPPEKLREGKRRHNSENGEEGLKTSRASSHHGDRIHRRHSQENYH